MTAMPPVPPPPAANRPQPCSPEEAARKALAAFHTSPVQVHFEVEVQPPPGRLVTSGTMERLIREASWAYRPAMDVDAVRVELLWPGDGINPSRFVVSGVRKA